MTWLLVILGVAALVGRLRGGRLKNLAGIHARAWWLLLIGLAMQTVAAYLPPDRRTLAVGLLLGSYLPILLMVGINRNETGMWIAGIGIVMNFIVISLNGGMPVLPAAIEIAGGSITAEIAGKHVLLDASTVVPFLGDIIPLPGSVISLGDVFLAIGLGVFVEEQTRRHPRLFSRQVRSVSGSAAPR